MNDYLRRLLVAFVAAVSLTSCSPLDVPSLVGNLNRQSDIELVCEGAPAWLLLLDSLIARAPRDPGMLMAGVRAYTAYSGAVAGCGRPERAAVLSRKARDYGLALLESEFGYDAESSSLKRLEDSLGREKAAAAGRLFWGAYGWAVWVANQKGAPAALADLPRIEKLMLRVLELDEGVYHGGAHLFLGVYYGSRPRAYGGRPELARRHFERALALSGRRYLPALVAYARYWAKPAFDRALYQRLLEEVLNFDIGKAPDLTLVNLAAKRRAARMLAAIDDYF